MELAATLLTALFATPPQDPPRAPAPAAAQAPADAPHVEWQRSLADALAVQKATGLPLLIAVNMDGEVFNEQFANDVYRNPEFIALTRGYVCVVASPDRHTERDYDAFGNRIECPRFPGCTCSEHINIEPGLFERWLKPTRNAPRHVGVGTNGKVMFDRFLDQSMQTAIDAIRTHRGQPKDTPPPATAEALLTRHDAGARGTLERMYRVADAAHKRTILAAAAAAKNEPIDLLRMGLRDDDETTFNAAAGALAAIATKEQTIDVEDALARVTDAAIAKALLDRHAAIGKDDPATARMNKHLRAAGTSTAVGKPWSNAWRVRTNLGDAKAVEAELDRCEAKLKMTGADDDTRLDLAIAQAAWADLLIRDGGKNVQFWFEDALGNVRKIKAPALKAEVQALTSYCTYMLGDGKASGNALAGADDAASTREPDEWVARRALEMKLLGVANPVLTDTQAAGSRDLSEQIGVLNGVLDLLAARGGGREDPLLRAISVLELAGCRAAARARLETTAIAFPASPPVHDHWRARLMMDLGAAAMQRTYARWAGAAKDQPTAQWFAGLASVVAAEQHTRDQRGADAIAAYGDAIARFEKSAAGNADYADSANHYAVLALAGRADLLAAQDKGEAAVEDLLRAAKLRVASLDENDGLQRKPRAIAGRIAAALRKAGKAELADRLQPLLP